MSTLKRKRLLVDWRVQGALALRCTVYLGLYLFAISSMLLIWRMLANPTEPVPVQFKSVWQTFAPAVVAALLLLPVVLTDMIRMSNRFAGPLMRLRSQVRALARGEHVAPLRFRDGDYWHEVAEEFNAMLNHLEMHAPPSQSIGEGRSDFTRSPVPADIEH